MEYRVNEQSIQLHFKGERAFGPDKILLNSDDDLTKKTSFNAMGYDVFPLFDKKLFTHYIRNTKELLTKCIKKAGITLPNKFELTHYHRLVEENYNLHLAVINQTKLLQNIDFPVDVKLIENRISEICKTPLEIKNPFTNEEIFHFRIIRPHKSDHNPLHRDVWQNENRNAINLYIPIVGSNQLSSLTLVPGSHRWSEKLTERTIKGALMNNIQFNVPGLTKSLKSLKVIRANPAENEVLIFSPYLLHGGAINLNEDSTRISMEIRLWRK